MNYRNSEAVGVAELKNRRARHAYKIDKYFSTDPISVTLLRATTPPSASPLLLALSYRATAPGSRRQSAARRTKATDGDKSSVRRRWS